MSSAPPDLPVGSSPVHRVPDTRGRARISRLVAVVLVAVSQLAAAFAFAVSFFTSWCAMFGEECTPGQDAIISIAIFIGVVLGVGGPVMVAWLRRNAVWALTPVVVVGLAWVLTVIE